MNTEKDNNKRKFENNRLKSFLVIHYLLNKYFNGTDTEKEEQILSGWKPSDRDGIFKPLTHAEEKNASIQIHQRITSQFNLKLIPTKKRYSNWRAFSSIVAAVIVLGFITYFTVQNGNNFSFFKNSKNELVQMTTFKDQGKITKLTLIDGTIAYLNKNTEVKVSNNFNKEKREVWLTGEAWFDVAKNKDKPFVIHSNDFQIMVHGTSFNVKTYNELDKYVVSVTSGVVEVSKGNNVLGTLTKNDELKYDIKNNNFQITQKTCSDAMAWTKGELVLNDANSKELQLRLKQYFNVDVAIHGKAMENALINGSYPKGTTIEQILESLSMIYGIKYNLDGDKVTITVNN